MKQTSYTKIGTNKNQPRIWFEGGRLEACGFARGKRYLVIYDAGKQSITLLLDKAGNRIVSGKNKGTVDTPIIDLCAAKIAETFGGAVRVRADFNAGRIEITLHHEEAARIHREARTKTHLAEGYLTEGTLCAGIGVSTLAIKDGMERGGIEGRVKWIVDREGVYLDVAARNNPAITPGVKLVVGDLEEIEPHLLDEVDLLQVSLPCTGHSLSGKAKNGNKAAEEHSTDATAVFGFLAIVQAVQPSIIVSENVVQAKDSATYTLIRAALRRMGYAIRETALDGGHAGSLEQRTRYWFVAVSEGLDMGKLDLAALPCWPRQYETLGSAMEDIPAGSPMWSKNEYLAEKQVRDIAAGKGFRRQLVTGAATAVGTIGRGYLKRRSTEPFIVRGDGMERLLTPVEHARVKGIPEVLVDGISASTAHEGLGQSILYFHAVGIAKAIVEALTGSPSPALLQEPARPMAASPFGQVALEF